MRLLIPMAALLAVSSACQSGPSAEDVDFMTKSPAGLWIASEAHVQLDIQGDNISITRGDSVQEGSFTVPSDGLLRAEINGESVDMPFKRLNLDLEITLPGESQPTKFTQM